MINCKLVPEDHYKEICQIVSPPLASRSQKMSSITYQTSKNMAQEVNETQGQRMELTRLEIRP